jgi:hypothetical protein
MALLSQLMDLQVIGITDTGLDYNSCFFRDEAVALPICMGEGYVQTPGCVNYQHRKIVSYVSFLFSVNLG